MARDETRELWREGEFVCLLISCCAGAELQVRRGHADTIVLRELYPTHSDLYERARDLLAGLAASGNLP